MSGRRCPACGFASQSWDPGSLCTRCPLAGGCAMVCCPACGHTDVDVGSSRIAGWLAARVGGRTTRTPLGSADALVLTALPEGSMGAVRGFDHGIDPRHRLRLLGLGVAPGRTVEIVRQARVTVLRVDQTELAVEREVADRIQVQPLEMTRNSA
ncbi:MAG: FeoA family protein [Halobacteriales archaeon]|nr:FeoA family protein [Halobacteriales archaeon]